MTNKYNTVLYTGVTSDLATRIAQHVGNPGFGFTGRYNAKKLVYVEVASDMDQANAREKQIKAGSRQKKIDLVNSTNPEWKDLSNNLLNRLCEETERSEGDEAIPNLALRDAREGDEAIPNFADLEARKKEPEFENSSLR